MAQPEQGEYHQPHGRRNDRQGESVMERKFPRRDAEVMNSMLAVDTALSELSKAIQGITPDSLRYAFTGAAIGLFATGLPDPRAQRVLETLEAFGAGEKSQRTGGEGNTRRLFALLGQISGGPECATLLAKLIAVTEVPGSSETATRLSQYSTAFPKAEQSTSAQRVKPQLISGFPEYLPAVQLELNSRLDKLRQLFERYGFVPLQTPVVERLEVLGAKGGDTDKEMYLLQRVHADAGDRSDAGLGMRYDLTVPMARYVAQNFNELVFPFKRYQIDFCWRGERPQDGRYRQFMQADVDVVDIDNVALMHDWEIPKIVDQALQQFEVNNYQFRISNRKVLRAFLEALNIQDVRAVSRELDKLEKRGAPVVTAALSELGLDAGTIERCLAIGKIKTPDSSFVREVEALGVRSSLLETGLAELAEVINRLNASGAGRFVVDLSVTRGFDYYTGTVYEVKWLDHPQLGSIAAGGRYDDLAGSYINKRLPGVGMSLGISRIFGKLLSTDQVTIRRPSPTDILITLPTEGDRTAAEEIARSLRDRGVCTEIFDEPGRFGDQLRYASRKGIRYALILPERQIKDLSTGEQEAVDLATWNPARPA